MINPSFGILADDLTGAMDGGLQLFKRGFRVRIQIGSPSNESYGGATVVDTESRNASKSAASMRVREGVDFFRSLGLPLRYKKVDSTLRGNLGAELEELLAASLYRAVLFAPALPLAGRTTQNGHHYIDGIPIDKTEMASDPKMPIPSSSISTLLRYQTALPIGRLSLQDIRLGTRHAKSKFNKELANGARIVVCDALADDDLNTIAEVAREESDTVVPCGSAGLLTHVAGNWSNELPRPNHVEGGDPRTGDPVLVVSASMSDTTKAQIRRADEAIADSTVIRADHSALFVAGQSDDESMRIGQIAADLLRAKSHVFIDLAGSDRAYTPDHESALILRAVSRIVLTVCSGTRRPAFSGLVLTGGETAATVLSSAGSSGIEITGEAEPLIPAGIIQGGLLDGIPVVTKAGGFGSVDALTNACSCLASIR